MALCGGFRLDWTALAGRSQGDIQTRKGVRIERFAADSDLAQE